MMMDPMFAPESLMRRINSEPALLMGARAALLMQLAHPLVAVAVADHSRFRLDPMSRLRATVQTISTIVYGSRDQAQAASSRVNALHARVAGRDDRGRDYSAADPHLLMWVYATLVHTAVGTYDRFVCPLTEVERAAFYEESKEIARMFAIPDDVLPPSLNDLHAWMCDRMERGEIIVTPLARELAAPLIRLFPWVPNRVAGRLAFVAASLLPSEIREGYRLPLGQPGMLAVDALGRVSRALTPRTPRALKSLALKPLLRTAK